MLTLGVLSKLMCIAGSLQGLEDGMIFIEDFVCPGGAWVMWYGITLGVLQGLVAIAR